MLSRRAAKYAHDMLHAGEIALRLAQGMTYAAYCEHPSVPLAIERQFITIGEAL